MYETVLVAVDSGEESYTAAQEAVEITASGGTLHALSIVEKLPMHTRSGKAQKFDDDDPNAQTQAENAVSNVEHLAERADIDCVPTIKQGVPRQHIVSYAEEIGTDAIVLGKRSQQDVAGDLLGSTAERVIRNATVPVLTVPSA